MRLIEWGRREDYQPLERGASFPQFYENGDPYKWWGAMDFNQQYYWYFIQLELESSPNDVLPEALMMGGEL